jgi:hypothetical protein
VEEVRLGLVARWPRGSWPPFPRRAGPIATGGSRWLRAACIFTSGADRRRRAGDRPKSRPTGVSTVHPSRRMWSMRIPKKRVTCSSQSRSPSRRRCRADPTNGDRKISFTTGRLSLRPLPGRFCVKYSRAAVDSHALDVARSRVRPSTPPAHLGEPPAHRLEAHSSRRRRAPRSRAHVMRPLPFILKVHGSRNAPPDGRRVTNPMPVFSPSQRRGEQR